MVLRFILRYLANNEQLIERLAQSYPIRRAAQLTAYFITKSKYKGEEFLKSDMSKMLEDEAKQAGQKLKSFSGKFKDELKTGFSEMKDEMKKQKQKK